MKRTRLPSNLRPTTRECVHLVARSYTSGHGNKDGVHAVRSAVKRKILRCTRTSPLYVLIEADHFHTAGIESELLSNAVSRCENTRIDDLFCSCDLDLDPMTFIYELDPYSLEIYPMCKNELFTPSLSYDRHDQ